MARDGGGGREGEEGGKGLRIGPLLFLCFYALHYFLQYICKVLYRSIRQDGRSAGWDVVTGPSLTDLFVASRCLALLCSYRIQRCKAAKYTAVVIHHRVPGINIIN